MFGDFRVHEQQEERSFLGKKHFECKSLDGLYFSRLQPITNLVLQDRIKGDALNNMGGMEAALVCSMLKIVGTKLAPLLIKEFSSIAGVTKDLEELQDHVEEINIWLQTVGDKAMRNDRSSNWLKNLKDATYDAEDLINEFHIEAEKHDVGIGLKNVAVKYLWKKTKSFTFEYKTAQKI
ncbi:unnamed protein product [Urochloa humidicola]